MNNKRRKKPKHVRRFAKWIKFQMRRGLTNPSQIVRRVLLATAERAEAEILGQPDPGRPSSPNRRCKEFLMFINSPEIKDLEFF